MLLTTINETNQTQLPELNTIKSATIHNWDISTPKCYTGYDLNSGIQAKLIKPSVTTEPLTNTPLGDYTNIVSKDNKGGAVERTVRHIANIVTNITTPKKPWVIELSYNSKSLGVLRERILDQSKILVPKIIPKPGDTLAIAKLIQEARDQDLGGLLLNSLVYRYTSNNNLYRLFFGTVNKDSGLLPHLHYTNVYARLHRNPMATLQINLDHLTSDPNSDIHYISYKDSELPTMEQIYAGTY